MTAPQADPAQPTALERLREVVGVARASLRTERKHLKRLIERLEADESKAREAPLLREQGEVLKVQLKQVPRGADRVVLGVPWQPERRVEVELKRELSPQQNLERIFRRARGLERGQAVIAERWALAQERLVDVERLHAAVDALLDAAQRAAAGQGADRAGLPPVGAWLREATDLREAVRKLRLRVEIAPAIAPEQRRIVRKAGGELPDGVQLFTSPQGRPVLVGRSAAGNDALVTRLLRGRDLWFHVRDQTGAHVVLRLQGKDPPDDSEIRACAELAAHLSGLAKGDRAEVTCAAGKDVRKVKGAPAGAVYLHGGRALRVEVEAAVIDAFYARRPPLR